MPEVRRQAMGWDKSKTDPIRWAAKMKDFPREAINIFALEVFSRVVERTPVDTGAARQNWLVTLNQEDTSYDPDKKKGGRVMSEGQKVIMSAKGDDSTLIQNNVPYIRKLEYGKFTDKPETEKTIGGLSKQAPHGMVGPVLAQADQLFEKAVEIAKAKNE
jgi:hypothetical protein